MIAHLRKKLFLSWVRAFYPIDDTDMHGGFPGPNLVRDRFGDSATVIHDIVETGFARFVLTNRLRPHETGTRAGFKVVVREAKPIDAKIRHLRNFGKCGMNFPRVLVTMLFGQMS